MKMPFKFSDKTFSSNVSKADVRKFVDDLIKYLDEKMGVKFQTTRSFSTRGRKAYLEELPLISTEFLKGLKNRFFGQGEEFASRRFSPHTQPKFILSIDDKKYLIAGIMMEHYDYEGLWENPGANWAWNNLLKIDKEGATRLAFNEIINKILDLHFEIIIGENHVVGTNIYASDELLRQMESVSEREYRYLFIQKKIAQKQVLQNPDIASYLVNNIYKELWEFYRLFIKVP
jgi:hypothetical protein